MDAERRCACGREKCWDFPLAARVTYLADANDTGRPLGRPGTLAGRSVYDPFTATTWVLVRPSHAREDTPPLWVRCHNIVDVVEDVR
jgi:hypothetical protein